MESDFRKIIESYDSLIMNKRRDAPLSQCSNMLAQMISTMMILSTVIVANTCLAVYLMANIVLSTFLWINLEVDALKYQ